MNIRFVAGAALSTLALSVSASDGHSFEQGMDHYENGQYRLALPHIRAAAEAGDAHAQEMVGFMHAMGGVLYPGVALDRRQALRWFDLAAQNGQPVSRYMSCALRRAPGYPLPRQRLDCFERVADAGASPAP